MKHKNRKTILLILLIPLTLIESCTKQIPQHGILVANSLPLENITITQELDAKVADLVSSTSTMHSAIFTVSNQTTNFKYTSTSGTATQNSGDRITEEHKFLIASVTKTFVAARILQLIEQGEFTLDDKISRLNIFPENIITNLHKINGQSFGHLITIKQLLNHTSGMKDYLMDDRIMTSKENKSEATPDSLGGKWVSHLPAFLDADQRTVCSKERNCDQELYPSKTWSHWNPEAFAKDATDRSAGLLNYYFAEMSQTALFEPGNGAHYSDTNYLLLGLIIEKISGESLSIQLKKHIFDPLGMTNTYMSYTDSKFQSDKMISDWFAFGIPMITTGADTSWDWGGGGLVSTSNDLIIFISALMKGDLFNQPESLDAMLDPITIVKKDEVLQRGYGLGIGYTLTDLGPRWGHSGAWGAQMYYFTDLNIAVAGTVNDFSSVKLGDDLVDKLAKISVKSK